MLYKFLGKIKTDVLVCLNRIISIFQSHVRPIVRGKVGRKTEYGAKIGVSVVNGFTYIDYLSGMPTMREVI